MSDPGDVPPPPGPSPSYPPPPQPGAASQAGWPTPPSAEPTPPRRRRWPIVLLIVLVLLGGCGALATVVGFRVFGSVTAPIDRANEFLDAARSGGDAASHACGGGYEPRDDLANAQGQHLSSVNITNNRVATVDGTITLEDGRPATVQVILHRAGDDWCVSNLHYR